MSEAIIEAAKRLACIRNETVDEVLDRFDEAELKRCPKRFSMFLGELRQTNLSEAGICDDLAWVKLDNDRVFYSPITHGVMRKQYRFIADLLPACVTEDTYLAAIDVVHRYLTDFAWPPTGLIPTSGGNIVELGAYLGHKTVRFAEELAGKNGRVLAVEMIPENFEILRKNIYNNGLSDIVNAISIGVWDKAGDVEVYSKGRQRNSIIPLEQLESGVKHLVKVKPINDILKDWGVGTVDFVFVSVNGAEVEVLEAFDPEAIDVRSFFVAAPYLRDGVASSKLCRNILYDKGYEILETGNPNQVVAKRSC